MRRLEKQLQPPSTAPQEEEEEEEEGEKEVEADIMEDQESLTEAIPKVDESPGEQVCLSTPGQTLKVDEKLKLNYPLIDMIQKLTAMVNREKTGMCTEGTKHPYPTDSSQSFRVSGAGSTPPREDDAIPPQPPKKSKVSHADSSSEFDTLLKSNSKVMNYQCNICKFTSSSFEVLKVHVVSHGQQNEIVLMCSDCHLMFKNHDELEQHIKTNCEDISNSHAKLKDHTQLDKQTSACSDMSEPGRKKWYAYEEYGLYRCLICRYTCGQQRMLKTHAWKHAGEVDCSYPIFEEENESASLPDSTVAHTPQESESVSSHNVENEGPAQILVCDTLQVHESMSLEGAMKEHKVVSQVPAPVTEVIVVGDAMLDADQENTLTDSLLSSAHQIINRSPNKKGHVNVIVERLPGSEETASPKAFLVNSELVVKRKKLAEDLQVSSDTPDVYHADKNTVENEEIVIGWSSTVKSSEFQGTNENSPPVRRRTNSECLRLHSLAAEALVTMPIRIIECPKSNLRLFSDPNSVDPDTGQHDYTANRATYPKVDSSNVPKKCNSFAPNSLNQKEIKVETQLTPEPIKTGISMSLLKVIEKLKERTDQNATDEDILKELQDNAQSESTSDISGSLVDYMPHSPRPYRCRLCHYSSDNRGYIKQHLRVHRQRQPYQCPICDHIAENSNDLENHMINHCKTRTYECKHCAETFYYKTQLKTHELEHGGPADIHSLSMSTSEPKGGSADAEEKCSTEDSKVCTPKLYRCDVCNYTSSTYVGVRNHRKVHSSDKPYRCSLCGYVCSHPPSLKSHMWKHASDQNYNYEQVNKAINEAMSQSSRTQGELPKTGSQEDSGTKADDVGNSAVQPASDGAGYPENPKVNITQIAFCNVEKLQSHIRTEPELCVLLFCCCICGFESTSKDLLMEHMKAHEGEIINIILKKNDAS